MESTAPLLQPPKGAKHSKAVERGKGYVSQEDMLQHAQRFSLREVGASLSA